jgi:hypothetical protein
MEKEIGLFLLALWIGFQFGTIWGEYTGRMMERERVIQNESGD